MIRTDFYGAVGASAGKIRRLELIGETGSDLGRRPAARLSRSVGSIRA